MGCNISGSDESISWCFECWMGFGLLKGLILRQILRCCVVL